MTIAIGPGSLPTSFIKVCLPSVGREDFVGDNFGLPRAAFFPQNSSCGTTICCLLGQTIVSASIPWHNFAPVSALSNGGAVLFELPERCTVHALRLHALTTLSLTLPRAKRVLSICVDCGE